MNIEIFSYYILGLNIISFILFYLVFKLYKNHYLPLMFVLFTIISLSGGSIGLFLAMILFDRKVQKQNIMIKIVNFCILIMQIIIFLILRGCLREEISFSFIHFFSQNKILGIYLVLINLITFVIFGIDKLKAIRKKDRIKIVTLITLALIGAPVGSLIAMYVFHHKTNQKYLTIGIPLIMIIQIVIIFFVMNFQ